MGVINGVELELGYKFLVYCSASEISWTKVQYAGVGLQPDISQEWNKIYKSCIQVLILRYLEPYGPNL